MASFSAAVSTLSPRLRPAVALQLSNWRGVRVLRVSSVVSGLFLRVANGFARCRLRYLAVKPSAAMLVQKSTPPVPVALRGCWVTTESLLYPVVSNGDPTVLPSAGSGRFGFPVWVGTIGRFIRQTRVPTPSSGRSTTSTNVITRLRPSCSFNNNHNKVY